MTDVGDECPSVMSIVAVRKLKLAISGQTRRLVEKGASDLVGCKPGSYERGTLVRIVDATYAVPLKAKFRACSIISLLVNEAAGQALSNSSPSVTSLAS